jgi:hypothetical protein
MRLRNGRCRQGSLPTQHARRVSGAMLGTNLPMPSRDLTHRSLVDRAARDEYHGAQVECPSSADATRSSGSAPVCRDRLEANDMQTLTTTGHDEKRLLPCTKRDVPAIVRPSLRRGRRVCSLPRTSLSLVDRYRETTPTCPLAIHENRYSH